MNILLGLVLLATASLSGFAFANGYKRRLNFLSDMDNFLLFLRGNCAFLQDSIQKILDTQKTAYSADFNKFLSDLNAHLNKREEFFIEWQNSQKLISKDEAKFIAEFFLNFGKLDSLGQIEVIENAKQTLEEKLQKSKQLVSVKGVMSVKLGVILGIGLFIICI